MKKWSPLYLGILCLLCGCNAEAELPDNVQYIDFQAGEAISEEKQYFEHLETVLQSTIAEAFEFQSVSVEIQNADTSYVVSVVIESNNPDQKPDDIKAAVEACLSKMFPDGTEFIIYVE